MLNSIAQITNLSVSAFTVPTDFPESDGTLKWDSTTMILVEIKASGKTGIGYTYADQSVASFIDKKLKSVVIEMDALNIPAIFEALKISIRNEGNCGMAYMALSAVDNALWDLKAKLLDLPLCKLIGQVRDQVLIYGSGGFTSYNEEQLTSQLNGWADKGFNNFKIKIGRNPDEDFCRVKTARQTIGEKANLFIDANGAYHAKQALNQAQQLEEFRISWFEEPVSSDDIKGLNFVRENSPASIKIAAGEYGYQTTYFLNMLQHKAVDVLQADATRCGGITGFLKAGYLAEAFHIPFSFHCAPSLHLHASLCLNAYFIGEYFHDHVRIENMFFDGAPQPVNGYLKPDLSQPGLGLNFKHQDAAPYRVA